MLSAHYIIKRKKKWYTCSITQKKKNRPIIRYFIPCRRFTRAHTLLWHTHTIFETKEYPSQDMSHCVVDALFDKETERKDTHAILYTPKKDTHHTTRHTMSSTHTRIHTLLVHTRTILYTQTQIPIIRHVTLCCRLTRGNHTLLLHPRICLSTGCRRPVSLFFGGGGFSTNWWLDVYRPIAMVYCLGGVQEHICTYLC